MSLLDTTIWWHVYPLGFAGVTHAHNGRPPELSPAWLDYLLELGCNGLLLGPIFDSVSHGYDTVDYFRVDPRLGDNATFDRLAEQCRDRGIHLMLDGVFNHASAREPLVAAALDAGPNADVGHAIRWSGEHPYGFEGNADLITFNHADDRVVALVRDVMTHWLDRGASGWRLDAAYAVPNDFWSRVLHDVRATHPDAMIVGEVIHGDYPLIVAETGMDSVTQYELWKAIWSSVESVNFFELEHALGRHNAFLDSFLPLTFVSNHDVTRIASRVGNAGAVLAATILLTVGGSPSIYYGDEQGFRGVKEERPGGDDEVRPEFPAEPADLSPLGTDVHDAYRDLIALRRRHPWLQTAHTEIVDVANERIEYAARGDGEVRVVVQAGEEPFVCITAGDDGWDFRA